VRALIVDDSRAMRAVIRGTLAAAGYAVVEARHGRDALEQLEAHGPVDVVLLDWNMPEMTGLELVHTLRRDPRYQHLPIVMVTTEIEQPQMNRALEAGANEYVMKPFTPEVLLEKLEMLGVGPA
jgi:two-component system chemotaxis response regulator CheY